MILLKDDNPTGIRPIASYTILGVCVLVFLWQLGLGPEAGRRAVYALGMIPAVLTGRASLPPELVLVPPAGTVVTSTFLHSGWLHLIGNMLYLWTPATTSRTGWGMPASSCSTWSAA